MPTKSRIQLVFDVQQESAAVANQKPAWGATLSFLRAFGDGIAANKADLAYVAERTVATGADDVIDLNGVLTNALGGTFAALELVAMLIINKPLDPTVADNSTSLTVQGGATNPFLGFLGGTTPTIKNIGPGGVFLIASPNAAGLGPIVAATGDLLRVTNSAGASAKYQIALLGRTA